MMKSHRRTFRIAAFLATGALVAACGGGGGGGGGGFIGGGGGGGPTPTPPPINPSVCTTTNMSPQSIAKSAAATPRIADTARRMMPSRPPTGPQYVPGVVQVEYSSSALNVGRQTLAAREAQAGGVVQSEHDFNAVGKIVRTVRTALGNEDQAISQLRAMPGVLSADRAQYRYLQTTGVNFPNDPFLTKEPGSGTPYGPPFYQIATSGGQWNLHMICVAHAWGYAISAGNTFGVQAGATGGGTKIAIIDTGVDTTRPDISGRVIRFNTCDTGAGTCTTSAAQQHDNAGHGTDTAGIAAANTNDNNGFAGVGWNTQLIIEKVFPDPTSGCMGTACDTSASTTDVVAAINDAVANNAKVISMSLGGGGCPDIASEATAIQNALAAGVVVVAASGNGGSGTIIAPACNPGVIAVGASSLNDITNPISEKVASYSNYDASNPTAWGVVAPGGDPNGNSDADSLHWIEDIWTSTPAGDNGGNCGVDVFGNSGNCRVLIAGTSMATPHVAGVVALLLGVAPSETPAQIKTLLCNNAVNIGDFRQGCGRVEAYRSMAHLLGDNSVP